MSDRTSHHLGWRLVAVHRAVRPAQLPLIGPSWTIGRATDSAVVIAHDAVSRQHALILREDDQFRLSDVGSRNGTYLNGALLRGSQILTHRDLIGLGEAKPHLRFLDDHANADPRPRDSTAHTHHARLEYDDRRLRFSLYDRPLDLSPDEFRLLRHLYQSGDAVCARDVCAAAVWGDDAYRHEDGLDRLVDELRRKLRQLDPELDIVRTRITGGFILRV